jgi:hypothetical protein
MSAAAVDFDRSDYRAQVQALLDRIADEVAELRRLYGYGVRSAALAERKREVRRDRERLAELVRRTP